MKNKKIKYKILAIFISVLMVNLLMANSNINIASAATTYSKRAQNESTLKFWWLESDKGGAGVGVTVADVFLSETEYYTVKGSKVTYTKRSTDGYGKLVTGSWTKAYVTPASYYQYGSSGVKHKFTYSHEDGLFPGGTKMMYCQKSNKNITLNKRNNLYSKAFLTVYVEGALVPTQGIHVSNSLSVC